MAKTYRENGERMEETERYKMREWKRQRGRNEREKEKE